MRPQNELKALAALCFTYRTACIWVSNADDIHACCLMKGNTDLLVRCRLRCHHTIFPEVAVQRSRYTYTMFGWVAATVQE